MSNILQGNIFYWNERKSYGLVSIRQQDNSIEKFFLHMAQVEKCEPVVPFIGCVARFLRDEVHVPTRPGEFYRGIKIEILIPVKNIGGAA